MSPFVDLWGARWSALQHSLTPAFRSKDSDRAACAGPSGSASVPLRANAARLHRSKLAVSNRARAPSSDVQAPANAELAPFAPAARTDRRRTRRRVGHRLRSTCLARPWIDCALRTRRKRAG